jgi:hypothetical protein
MSNRFDIRYVLPLELAGNGQFNIAHAMGECGGGERV